MACNSYKKTLNVGTVGEKFVLTLLAKAGIRCWKNPEAKDRSVMIQWDLGAQLPGGPEFTLEVKYDQMEKKTGNVAVEYFNVKQSKPSGILATTADLWVFVLHDPMTAWVCRTQDLREWFENKPCHREIACGGDDNAAMKLYRRETLFKALFVRIDHFDEWALVSNLEDVLKEKHEREV